MSNKKIKVAVAGNPNVGKSTLFNTLTGTNQHVGNYPGVTVDIKTGKTEYKGYGITFVDLPGIYSMNSYSPEERVAREFIADETPDLIINIIDGTNLQKNMYLTLQLLEMKVPVLVFVNMTDIMKKKQIFLDVEKFSREIETPVTAGSAKNKEGINKLFEKIISTYEKQPECTDVPYSEELNHYVSRVCKILEKEFPEKAERWRGIRIIEGGCEDMRHLSPESEKMIGDVINDLKKECDIPVNSMLVIQERYHLIKKVAGKVLKTKSNSDKPSKSEKFDNLILHRAFSIPLFLLVMFLMFQMVFTLGDPVAGYLENFFGFLSESVHDIWPASTMLFLKSLIADGIIPGVGGVIVFAPFIFLMFLGISIMEDTGYLSRISVIMDHYMNKIGLSGKSFLPMVLGFGCSIPAIMATRIISNKKERLVTMIVLPFISCSARLPVYLLLIAAFFPQQYQGITLFLIYLTGIFMSLILARILRKYVIKGKGTPLFVELPDYTTPTFRSIFILTWERGKHFLQKAGTVILAVSVILWILNTYPKVEIPETISMSKTKRENIVNQNTLMGRFSKFTEPAFKIMGGDWKIASSFIASLAAKELFVSQLSMLAASEHTLEGSGSMQIRETIRSEYSFPAAVAFLLFILLTAPCIATFAIMRAETNTWKWPFIQFIGMFFIAYGFSTAAYQILMLIV